MQSAACTCSPRRRFPYFRILVALGASGDADGVTVLEGGMTYGVLSMESYAFKIGAPGPRLGPILAV
jgi:4,5-DOPA dioxygenase extradiol